jgi:hypothetical protein
MQRSNIDGGNKQNKPPIRKRVVVAIDKAEPGELPTRSLPEILCAALKSFEQKMAEEEGFKPTLGEYLKLLQMQRDLDLEVALPREITVTWVDPPEISEER